MSRTGSPILHLPGPRPDEIFYSIASRFCWTIRYPSNRDTMKELFGCEHVVATIEFPTRLAYLQEHLDYAQHPLKDEAILIDQTTLLPWYAPFLPPARVTQMRATMLHGTGEGLHTVAGIVAGGVPTPAFIRYCPACMKDTNDKHEYRLRNVSERRRSLIHIDHPPVLAATAPDVRHRGLPDAQRASGEQRGDASPSTGPAPLRVAAP